MFDGISPGESRPVRLLRSLTLLFLALCFVTAMTSGHREYFQVRSLELRSSEPVLHAGSVVETEVVSSGRTHVDVRVELIQDAQALTLAAQLVPGNEWGAIDPRTRRATQSVVLTPEMLSHFHPGTATLRATATGRPQWLRLPPPTVREFLVVIRRD